MNIAALIESLARSHRDVPALVDLQQGSSLTFGELEQAVHGVGHGIEKLRIPPGARVALLGGNDAHDAQYILCDYGVMSCGRIRVPLDPSLSVAEQLAQLRDSEASAIICTPALRERAETLAGKLDGVTVAETGDLCGERATGGRVLPEAPAAEQLASLSYTGGSTGSPKAVVLTHGNLTSAVQNVVLARGMGVGDRMLNMRPVWPIAAIRVLAHLAAGGTVFVGGKFDPEKFITLLERHRIAMASLVPTHLARLLKDIDHARYDLSHLKSLDIGGAGVPPQVFLQALDAFGPKIGITYGLTEAPSSCYQPPSALDVPASERSRWIRTTGRPLFGVEIAIRSPEGGRLGANEEGEVTIRGAHVARGYWKREEATALAFRGGWFHTGDLGVVDENGVLSITGRLKELIRTGGKSVLPSEVEETLLAHPAVNEAAVVGVPDVEWGETVAAAVVLHPNQAATEEEIIQWCRERLSSFKRPKRVRFIAELPRSHYGKIQRAKVLDIFVQADRRAGGLQPQET